VKTAPVFFHLRKNIPLDFNWEFKTIPYESEQTNIGNNIDKSTGIFTAPQAGKYYFIASGVSRVTSDRGSNTSNGRTWLYILKNGGSYDQRISSSFCDELEKGQHCVLVGHATVNLKAGDKIYTAINGENAKLWDDENRYTSFAGWLIEEDLSLTLASI
jgi:hypothetical protein